MLYLFKRCKRPLW